MAQRESIFSNDDDIFLAQAWLNASKNPITDNMQGENTFWSRVAEYFRLHNTAGFERDEKSLQQRWQKITPKIQKFVDCLAQVENVTENSGNSDTEKIQKALLAYTTCNSTATHKQNFMHLGAWSVLRHHFEARGAQEDV